MGTRTKQEYFAILRERYRIATSKSERSKVIDEAIENTGLHRKSAIRALNQAVGDREGLPKLGRPEKYSHECQAVLKKLYRASEYQCSDKLKVMIPILLSQFDLGLSPEVLAELVEISPATIDRYLAEFRAIDRRRRNSTTRPGSLLFKKLIPLKCLTLVSPRAGYLEADTVAHCGTTTAGEYVNSLTVTDTFTGWTENRAMLGKTAKNVLPAIQSVHEALPFELVSINVDNGSEFLNGRVYEYYRAIGEMKAIPLPMSRSRSYQKNDNAHVEQKNWTHVRQLFGYDRFESKELVPLMNEIYSVQNQIQNFFHPQFKLKSKIRVGSRIKKKYDSPATPYSRALADPSIPDHFKLRLQHQYQTMNYFELKSRREELLARFIELFKQLSLQEQPKPLLTAAR